VFVSCRKKKCDLCFNFPVVDRPQMNKYAKLLLLAGCALCLLQIWLPAYYLTGDGPSHIYNAQIVHDMWCHKNTAFYEHYYTMSYSPNPNWLTTIAIALLLFVVNGVIAEKIFLSVYVVFYLTGANQLLKKISNNEGPSYWPVAILLFVFSYVLSKGFYNYSFSIGVFFWVIYCWLEFMEKRSVWKAFLCLFFTGFIFFTHLLSFGFAAFTCAALAFSYALAAGASDGWRKAMGTFIKNTVLLTLFFLPFLFLMNWFTEKKGGMQMELTPHLYRLVELVQFKYGVNVTHKEDYFALAAGTGLLLLFCVALVKFKKYRAINKYDGFLLSFLFVLFVYLFFPDSFLGMLVLITIRVQLYVLILIVCCIAYIVPEGKLKNAGALFLFTCFVVLSAMRLQCQVREGSAVADIVSAELYIKPYSVVLPFDFVPSGKDQNGFLIADANWPFTHVSQYMGMKEPLIVLDNYEANMGFFPLQWNQETNPYYHLNTGEGMEAHRPFVDIDRYKKESGVTIDYILMWCYDQSFLGDADFKKLYENINAGYHLVYTSPTGRTILYEKNR